MKSNAMLFGTLVITMGIASGCNADVSAQQNEYTQSAQEMPQPPIAKTGPTTAPTSVSETSNPLPRSDSACDAGPNTATCQTADFNGDGKVDRVYIATPGNFSVLNSIYENDALGEGLTSDLDYRVPAVVVELGGTTEDQAINLAGASSLQRISGAGAKDPSLPAACAVDTDKPIILAIGPSEKIMIALDGKIISARRC